MRRFLEAIIAHFWLKKFPNRMTVSSIFKQKLNSSINREIRPDLIRASLKYLYFILPLNPLEERLMSHNVHDFECICG